MNKIERARTERQLHDIPLDKMYEVLTVTGVMRFPGLRPLDTSGEDPFRQSRHRTSQSEAVSRPLPQPASKMRAPRSSSGFVASDAKNSSFRSEASSLNQVFSPSAWLVHCSPKLSLLRGSKTERSPRPGVRAGPSRPVNRWIASLCRSKNAPHSRSASRTKRGTASMMGYGEPHPAAGEGRPRQFRGHNRRCTPAHRARIAPALFAHRAVRISHCMPVHVARRRQAARFRETLSSPAYARQVGQHRSSSKRRFTISSSG